MAWVGAAAGCAGGCALFWPGIAETDTVDQYQQVLTGHWRDWHPPVVARWWGVLHAGVGGGAAPMLVGQMVLYWLGLALLAAALADIGRSRAAAGVLAVGAWPPLFGWEAVVLKDPEMVASLVAMVGIVTAHRLRGQRLGGPALAGVTVLTGYAVLVRANAVFAVALLAGTALRHPLAYLAHRLAHWNAPERWLVPAGLQGASPFLCEPNTLGLAFPGPAGMAVLRALDGVFDQPLCWPICWTVAAVTGLAVSARRPRVPARDLALALLGSAVALEASFLVVCIASDWRYHLWPLVATPLALVLLLPGRPGEGACRSRAWWRWRSSRSQEW